MNVSSRSLKWVKKRKMKRDDIKKDTNSDCGSLRAREDTSKEEKSRSEEGNCVKGSRMRKTVMPPVAVEDLWLTEVRENLMKV